MRSVKRWWRERKIRRNPLDTVVWETVIHESPMLRILSEPDQATLRRLATLFVLDKDFYGAGGLELSQQMIVTIAAHSCLPALRLGFDCLLGWHSIYVYPGQFRSGRALRDENGLEWVDERVLAGEAHGHGGMVLSWTDVAEDIAVGNDGQNVVIHEIAHKLDMLNGDADGFPPLRRGMSRQAWTEAMTKAFAAINEELDRGRRTRLDPYAATEPAEFFAVMSEYYFETPETLASVYPEVHDQLQAFYGG